MNDHSPHLQQFLLERSTKLGLANAGVLLVVAGITAERLILIILGVCIGVGILILAFRDFPARLTRVAAEKRGARYVSMFSILMPIMLSLAFGSPAGFLLIVLLSKSINPPWGILLSGAVMGICSILNLVMLIMNASALAKS